MSRLDSAIRRLSAQRACLDLAARLIADLPGPVLELGLGNGRSYDHLRARLPDREIFVFDRQVAAHPDCIPDPEHLILGDFRATLPAAAARLAGRAALRASLAHADFGSGDPTATAALAAFLGPAIRRLMAPGGIVVSDQPLAAPGLTELPPPEEVPAGRYFLYRAA